MPPKGFDISLKFRYHSQASKLDSRAGGAKGPPVRKVRAPQGKDNGQHPPGATLGKVQQK